MASNRFLKKQETHFKVIRLLSENPELSTRELAQIVGVSNGSAYYCINALIEKGFIKLENFRSSNDKRRYAYILTPRGLKEKAVLTTRFLHKKLVEYDDLREEILQLKQEMKENNEKTIFEK